MLITSVRTLDDALGRVPRLVTTLRATADREKRRNEAIEFDKKYREEQEAKRLKLK